jgi:isopentenyl diphosphate isomerase/L-lactate dehydrogenase-like FMN-dependent dehydrogenase
MTQWASIDDLAQDARRRLPRFVFDFLEGGAGEGAGAERNHRRLHDLELMPRYLTGLERGDIDPAVKLFGRRYAQPFGIAPTGGNGMIMPGGDLVVADAARQMDIPVVNSTMGSASLEEVAAVAGPNTWFQLYAMTDEAVNNDLVRRAEAAGVDVFVMTVDIPSAPNRNRDTRNNFGSAFKFDIPKVVQMIRRPRWLLASARNGPPTPRNFAPYGGDTKARGPQRVGRLIKTHANWEDVRRLRDRWKGRLVLKGLMSAEDAVHAAEIGCDGVWVSNHGGRQLESAPAPIDCLAPVVAALRGRAATLIDGGFYTGEDVVKALALGADMVFLGRGPLYGLGAGGRAGVDRAMDIYKADVARTLLQIGCPSVAELRRREIIPGIAPVDGPARKSARVSA